MKIMNEDNKNLKEPNTTSNQTILKYIDYYMHNPSIIDFLKKESTWQKLTQFLSYYNSSTPNDSIPDMKLGGKYPVTQLIKDLINQVSTVLNTSKSITFNLIGDCFLQNPKMARHFMHLESIATQNNTSPNISLLPLSEIIDDIIYYYYNERLTLIDIIMRLLDTTYTQLDSYFDNVRNITNDLIYNYNLFGVIWKQFVSYSSKPIRKGQNGLIDEEQLIQILKEQKKMLDCMIILSNINEHCNKDIFQQMLQYFDKTEFTCYLIENFGNNSNTSNSISDLHRNELEDLISNIIEKSILLTIVNFIPSSLYEIIIDNPKQIDNLKSTPMEIPFHYYSPFLNKNSDNRLTSENYRVIEVTINAMYSIIEPLQKRGWLVPLDIQRHLTNYKQYIQKVNKLPNEENVIEYLINMLQRYIQNNNNINASYDYFSNYYKYVLMKWVNLVISSVYDNDITNYPQLILLTTMVLDSPLTRDEFFYREKKKESLIYKLFLHLKENDITSMNFLNFCFSLSEPKKRSEYNEDLFSLLTTYSDNNQKQKPFFADIVTTWQKMNNNLKNDLQFEITNNDDNNIINEIKATLNKQIQTIRLFLRLYSTVPRSDEMVITMNICVSNIFQRDIIIQDKDKDTHFSTLLNLILQSLLIFTNNRDLYLDNINIIIEMYNTLIEMFNKPQSNLQNKFTSELCDKLCLIIFNSISIDFSIKDYTVTVKAFKLIKTILSFANIISFIKLNNKVFISNIFQFVINGITAFTNKTSFEIITEIKLVKELCQIMDQLYSILITNVNKTPILNKNISSNSNIVFDFICNLLNQVDMSEFLLNYLRVKIKIDTYQNVLKNKYIFVNTYLDLLITNINDYNNSNNTNNIFERMDIVITNKIKKMLCENLKCLNTIFNLVLLYKISNDNKTLYELNIIKKWTYSLFTSKIIPSLNCESSNIMANYDVNLIMLLFIYTNFEIENNLPLNPFENDNFLDDTQFDLKLNIKDEITLTSLLFGKFISDKYLNVSTLAYSAICKLVYLFQIDNNTNETSTFNIMNYMCIKKSANVEKEGMINVFEIIKENIIRQLLQGIYFLNEEILKLLCICTSTQVNFISSMLEDFSYLFIEEKKFWEVIMYSLPKLDVNTFDDAYVNSFGYTIMFVSKIINKDVLYKKTLRDFFKDNKFKCFLQQLIKDCLHLFKIDYDKITQIHNQIECLFSNYIDNKEFYIQVLKLNQHIIDICFNYIIVQNMCLIFKKLITFTDTSILNPNTFVYEICFNDFMYNQLLKVISNYTFIPATGKENTLDKFNKISNEIFHKGNAAYALYIQLNQVNINFNVNNVNVLLADHSNLFGYGYSYCVDLKELYTHCVFNEEYLDLFKSEINNFIKYNLTLSVFEARTQAMYASTYLIGLMFTIGPCGYSMSTSFFTGVKVYEMLNAQKMNNKINDDVGNVIEMFAINNDSKIMSMKLNFNVMKLFNENDSELIKFVNNEIFKHLVIDLKKFNNESMLLYMNNMNKNELCYSCSGYINLISLNYNILNYILDFLLYKLKIKPEIVFPQHELLSILSIILSELNMFISSSSQIQTSNTILSIITSVHSILNYLLLSKYKYNNSTLSTLINPLMQTLITYYNNELTYRAIITFIFNTYSHFISNPFDNIIISVHDNSNTNNNSNNNSSNSNNTQSFITCVMSKFNESISEIEYQSLLMLLITLLNKHPLETFEMILNTKLFYYLKMINSFKDTTEYEHNERSSKHILWCWTLKFISTLIMKYISLSKNEQNKYHQIYYNTLEHFRYNEERVITVLSNCDYMDSNKNKVTKSLAFLEEVNMITEVITSIIIFYNKNNFFAVNDNGEFYYKCVELFLEKTLMLFTPNTLVYKLYKSNSSIEKKMEDLHLSGSSSDNKNDTSFNMSFNRSGSFGVNGVSTNNNNNNDINSSSSNNNNFKKNFPLRLNVGYTYVSITDTMNNNNNSSSSSGVSNVNNSSMDIMATASSKYKSNISNLFTYRIEQLLNQILFNISTSIRLIMNNQQYSYRQYIEDCYNSDRGYLYLDVQLKNIMNSYYFSICLLENMVQMNKLYLLMYNKAQLFYDNICVCNKFGFLMCEPFDNKDMFKLNNYSINHLLCISVTMSECFKSFTMRMQHAFQFENQFKEMMVKPLQSLVNKMKERDAMISEMKGVSEFFGKTAEWVKNALI